MSNMQRQADEMNLDVEQAQGWRPSEGEVLVGEILAVQKGWSDFRGNYYPILVIQPTDNLPPVAVHCLHYTLESRVLALKPMPGETIGIRYAGQTKSKDGKRTISIYAVKVKGRDEMDPYADMAPVARTAQQQDARQQQIANTTTQIEPNDDIPF